MGIKHTGMIRQNSRGETMIEVIVSFALAVLVLVAVTVMLKAAIGIKQKALDVAKATEDGVLAVETQSGQQSQAVGRLTVDFGSRMAAIEFKVYENGGMGWLSPMGD